MPKREYLSEPPPASLDSPESVPADAIPVDAEAPATLSLSPEQVQKAGLANAAVGDEYEVTLRCRITNTGDIDIAAKKGSPAPGMDVEVVGYSNAKQVTDEPDEMEPSNAKNSRTFKSRALSPSDAGMM